LPTRTSPRSPSLLRSPRIIRLDQNRDAGAFGLQVRQGLGSTPKTLPCQFIYDETGSQLFERICGLPEYYLTRTEDAILKAHATAMVEGFSRSPAVVELGSGSSTKTRRLLNAAMHRYRDVHYVPIDVSPSILSESAEALAREFPGLRVTGFAADYHAALERLSGRLRRPTLFVFLGSSLGNFEPRDGADLLAQVARTMTSGDALLLGTDLDKDPSVLKPAYDDAQGVTARFAKNILVRINRELGGDFRIDRFHHEARYNRGLRRVESHLVSLEDQTVTVSQCRLSARLRKGESIHAENSYKYTPDDLAGLAEDAGLLEEAAWTDRDGLFRVQRWRKKG
jgi:dimethylhistidine N-methyltransferase